jgi:hypothetical protein
MNMHSRPVIHELPPGWHSMLEIPSPGKSRLFRYDVPGEGFKVSEAPTMTTTVWNADAPGGHEAVTLQPIAWRYR